MFFRPLTSAVVFFAACVAATLLAQAQEPALAGRIEGNSYVSPTKAFRVDIPVLPELGGTVTDTENVVTFQDDFNVHASIACFEMDATQRWENETRGRKDYLIWFFSNFIQADFQQRFPGASLESALFMPTVQDGALLTYNLLPGGSMFTRKLMLTGREDPPVAKRGNLLFVKNGRVFIISIELAEKVLERFSYDRTIAQEDAILRRRLMDLLGKMSFTPPSTTTTADKAPRVEPAK